MRRGWLLIGAVLCAVGGALWIRAGSGIGPSVEAGRRAAMNPDYDGAVIPPNVAPLNVRIREKGSAYRLRITGAAGGVIEVSGGEGGMRIPAASWGGLLRANAGRELTTEVWVKGESGWTHFDAVRNRVAVEETDPYVVYRYMPPIYDKWGRISLRQRDLRTFEERVLLDNERSTDATGATPGSVCINCHTFLGHRTARMLIHSRPSRSGRIPAMVVVRDGRAAPVDTRAGGRGAASYPSWHPSGKLVAFSRNSLLQIFHTAGVEVREVIDRDSDLGLYDVESGKVWTAPPISRPDRLETWPAWSPDGRYLYFSAATRMEGDRKVPPANWQSIRYDLDRVAFDAATGRWGEVETVVRAEAIGRSVSEPVVSPDGRFLLFTGHDHGSFPIFQPGADLYVVDLQAGAVRRVDEVNSERADSYHSWSSNGRWIVFASKREDGVFTRLYIAHHDGNGRFGRPFLLPQEDPDFYGRCAMVFNRPEFVAEAVTVSAAELTRAINAGAGGGEGKGAEEPYRPVR